MTTTVKFYNENSQIERHAVDHKTTEKKQSILLLILKSKSLFSEFKIPPLKLLLILFSLSVSPPGLTPSTAPPVPSTLSHSGLLAEHKTTNMFNLSGFLQCYSIKLAISERI